MSEKQTPASSAGPEKEFDPSEGNPIVDSPEKRAARRAEEARLAAAADTEATDQIEDESTVMPGQRSLRGRMAKHPFLTAAVAATTALGVNAATGHPVETQFENITTPDAVIDTVSVQEDEKGWIHAIQVAIDEKFSKGHENNIARLNYDAYDLAAQIPEGATSIELLLVDEGATGKVELVPSTTADTSEK